MSNKKPVPRVAALRSRAGLTQLELAQRVGVTETTVANWEKGRSGTDWFERVMRLCKTLDCLAEDLIEYQPIAGQETAKADGLSLSEIHTLIGVDQSPSSQPDLQDSVEQVSEGNLSNLQDSLLQK